MSVYEPYSKRLARENGELNIDIYRYENIGQKFLNQCKYILNDNPDMNNPAFKVNFYQKVMNYFGEMHGIYYPGRVAYSYDYIHLFDEVFQSHNPHLELLDLIEISMFYMHHKSRAYFKDAVKKLNQYFAESGLGYEYIHPYIIKKTTQITHQNIVKPAINLLHQQGFETANKEYLDAHENYRHEDFSGAVTEAAKAFESVMKIICAQHKLDKSLQNANASKLIDTLINSGLIPEYHKNGLDNLKGMLESIATPRNKVAAHGAGEQPRPVPKHLVEYVLHTTAAKILYLVAASESKNN